MFPSVAVPASADSRGESQDVEGARLLEPLACAHTTGGWTAAGENRKEREKWALLDGRALDGFKVISAAMPYRPGAAFLSDVHWASDRKEGAIERTARRLTDLALASCSLQCRKLKPPLRTLTGQPP